MVKVNFIRDDETLSVDVPAGWTVMEAAKELDLREIPADCGGCQACGTCHVHVDEKWLAKVGKIDYNTPEIELLEYEKGYIEGKSRLSCQIKLTPELDGLIVHLRNDELL